ncbi:GRB10-interacting GYF protein 2-like isoform X2 [Ischnura elegans]|uniref:GRB10-interacting GYF protein 2-like isoform X2 n=1 Tax=Ischnura elegans TaxID=197161 RepID=UPI001ED88D9A|nr:GRB10-interacting GYF protein 2-like isoform X2 [Ischnura elegans]
MTDSLKFGPEWLRVLSQDTTGTQVASGGGVGGGGGGGAPHRYQLAEHRYGREEMLALFDRLTVSRSGPDLLLRSFPTLYVEKPQPPLALVQMTEEEARTWQRGINSESVLRGPGSLRGGVGAGGGMGRGSVSMDRGVRGRGRGGGGYYVRGGMGGYEEESSGDGSSSGPWRRGIDSGSTGGSGNLGGPMTSSSSFNSRVTRSFDRSQGTVSERGWGERNGTVDSNDWNGSTSPRKDYGRGLMENWRSRGSTEEEDTWRVTNRTEKWGRNSWREGGSGTMDREQESGGRSWEGSGEGGGSHHRARSGGWEDGHRPNIHRHSWDEPDKLPECESGGSFDASGAFHGGGGYSDDDEKGHVKDRPEGLRRLQQGLGPLRRNSGSRGGGSDGNRGPMLLRTVSESEADHQPSMMTGPSGGPSRSVSGHMAERSISSEVGSSPEGSKGSVLTSKQDTSIPPPNISNTSPPSVPITVQSSKSTPPHSPPVPTPDPQSRPDSNRIGQQNKLTDAGQTRASSVPTNTPNQMTLGMVDTSVSSLDARGQQRQRSEEDLERMQEVADDLVAKLMDEEEDEVEIRDSRSSGGVRQPGSKDEVGRDDGQVDGGRLGAVPGSTPSQDDPTATLGDKWYYQDPQGIVQGPFGSGEMADWFRAGYFNTTLLVRRACDECFSQLGDLMKLWGRIPFLPGPNPPPLKAPMADPAIAAASAPMPLVAPGSQAGSGGSMGSVNQAENLFMQQHYQYQILQRQLFMRQQAAVQAIMEKLSLEHQQSVIQQLMGGQQQGQGPQQPNQPPPHQPSPPHHAADGMNTFIQPPFKMQSDLGGPKNPVMALINQIHQQQQAKVSQSADGLIGPQIPTSPKVASDPISQLIQQVALQQQQQQPPPHPSNTGVPSHHQPQRPSVDQGRPPSPVPVSGGPGSQQPTPGGKQESDPIQSILRLLEGRSNGNPLVNQPPVEPVWGGPFAVQSWLAQAAAAGSQVGAPPGQLLSQGASPGSGAPISLWDLQGKDVKTEQQILEEQMRAEEERKKEEIRKQEEAAAKKKAEEEERKRKQLEEELRQKEAERRRLEEQMRKLEEEKRAEEARRKEEERRMAEERRRLEERLRQEQELKQKLLAEEKKQLQEMKRLAELKQKREEAEERKRKEKEEEAARKQKELEQQQLQEAEKKKQQQEEEIKRQKQQQQQQQQDEAIRRLEIQRRLAEAQRKSQEAQMKGQEAQIAATAAAAATIPTPSPPTNQRQASQKSQAPWAQQQGSAAVQPTSPPIANLAEIQRMQEKEEKEMLQQRLAQKMREKEAAIAQAQTEREHHPQPESPVPVARPASGQQPKAVSGGGGGGSGGGSGTAIQLKWADKRPQPAGPVKSLAEIQAEEHEQQLARERERAEKAAQQASQSGTPASGGGGSSQGHSTSSATPVGGIWSSATSALTWAARSAGHGGWAAAAAVGAYGSQANHTSSAPANASQPAASSLSSSSSSSNSSNSSPAVWSNAGQNSWASNNVTTTASSGGGGFWEEVPATPQPVKSSGKQGGKSAANSGKTAASAAVTAQPAGGKGKGKSRKDEVMKIFEQNVQRSLSAGDEFTQWCLKTLGNLQTSVDIPTFVGFLKDIDSPYEVSDYVRNYLGDGKEAREFSRNFLERRSRWRNAQKAAAAPPSEDDMCVPAPAVNPLSSEFQEVKGKGKKAKKNKMMRLDNRILGFSVTASHDRINVGDRDYGEGV